MLVVTNKWCTVGKWGSCHCKKVCAYRANIKNSRIVKIFWTNKKEHMYCMPIHTVYAKSFPFSMLHIEGKSQWCKGLGAFLFLYSPSWIRCFKRKKGACKFISAWLILAMLRRILSQSSLCSLLHSADPNHCTTHVWSAGEHPALRVGVSGLEWRAGGGESATNFYWGVFHSLPIVHYWYHVNKSLSNLFSWGDEHFKTSWDQLIVTNPFFWGWEETS